MSGRLQGKTSDPSFKAEAKLFFGFWSGRPDVLDRAARELMVGERFKPYHVTDTVIALLELGRTGLAEEVLRLYERTGRGTADAARFETACLLSRAAILALRGELPEAEKLLLAAPTEPNDRGYNAARLIVARAEYQAGRTGQLFLKVLRAADRHDSFAREHRAWFCLKLDDPAQAATELAPLVVRGSHERGRNLTNFLHGLCLLRDGRADIAARIFALLPFPRFPRTWTLGSHCGAGRLAGERLERYLGESFPWERKHLYAQMALLARARGDAAGFDAYLRKSRQACLRA
jgi:hypothetical protein